jgi:hypothetical protein
MMQLLLSQVSQPDPSVGSLPLAAHMLALLGLIGGLVLWLVGQKVIKPVFGALGGVLGGLIGFLTMPSIAPADIGGIPSPYIGLGIGAVFGLGAGLMLFRFAVAISTGIALGLAGILISAASIHFTPLQDASKNLGNLQNSAIKAAQSPIDPTLTSRTDKAMAVAKPVAQTVKEFVESQADDIRASWNSLQGHEQVVLGLSGVGGLVAGFFVGLFFPRKSAAVATSLFGSAVWVPSLMWLVNALEIPGRQYLDRGPIFWLIVWVVIAVIGIAIQVSGHKRKPPAQQ